MKAGREGGPSCLVVHVTDFNTDASPKGNCWEEVPVETYPDIITSTKTYHGHKIRRGKHFVRL